MATQATALRFNYEIVVGSCDIFQSLACYASQLATALATFISVL